MNDLIHDPLSQNKLIFIFVILRQKYFCFPGVNALKFTTETNSIRLCRKIGDIFEPPEDGWGDRLYIVHAPGPPLYQQGVPTSGKLSVQSIVKGARILG